MFSNKKADESKNSSGRPSSGSLGINSLVQGTVLEGTIEANTDIRVDGIITGKLFCDAKVIIGPSGAVKGEITCENAVIEGRFEGTITVKDLLNIRETAVIEGEVTTSKLLVQAGSLFNVSCVMSKGGAAPKSAQETSKEGKKESDKVGKSGS